jgi:ABC-type bacteriocin/lantibiotic exporter with double-glycine peptidase domain
MFGQELPMSCGAACARQLLSDKGINTTESIIRELANFEPEYGIDASSLANALNKLSPESQFRGGSVPPEAFEALNKRGAWIARVKPSSGAHFVIVDGVDNNNVLIRDPWEDVAPGVGNGLEAKIPVSEFMDYWNRGINQAVF